VIRYGTNSPDARLVAENIEAVNGGSKFDVTYDGDPRGSVTLKVPGMHNIRNALAAIATGIAIGVKLEDLRSGLESFTGVERRFQRIADIAGVSIIDDYAHHPTEIRATLQAARSAFPGRRIIAAFQPHLYTRTRDFHIEFAEALAMADVAFLCDLYPAREKPIAGVSSDMISGPMRSLGKPVKWQGPETIWLKCSRILSSRVMSS
jgi:UDP-N-acetylmuramate-alanine ligase